MEITGPRQPLTFFQAAGAHYKERFEAASTKAEKVTIKKQFFEVLRGRRIAYHRANGNVYNLFNSSVATRNIFYFSKISYAELLVFPRIDKITLNQYISYYVMPFLFPEGREALYSYLDRYGPLMTISEADIITCFKEHLSINILSVKFPDVLTAIESIPSKKDIQTSLQVVQKRVPKKRRSEMPTLDGDFLRNFDRFMQETKFLKTERLSFSKKNPVKNPPLSLALINTLQKVNFNNQSGMNTFPARLYSLLPWGVGISGNTALRGVHIDGRDFPLKERIGIGIPKEITISRAHLLQSFHVTHTLTSRIILESMKNLTTIKLQGLRELNEVRFTHLLGLKQLVIEDCQKLSSIDFSSLAPTSKRRLDCKIELKNLPSLESYALGPKIHPKNITIINCGKDSKKGPTKRKIGYQHLMIAAAPTIVRATVVAPQLQGPQATAVPPSICETYMNGYDAPPAQRRRLAAAPTIVRATVASPQLQGPQATAVPLAFGFAIDPQNQPSH